MVRGIGDSMSDKLVVFYSWGGNTKAVAEYISERVHADVLELTVAGSYPAEYNACVNKVGRDGRRYEPELACPIPDLKKYNVLFAGSPCWWGTIANPLRTFLRGAELEGKTIAPFMTHGTSGLHVQDINILCPGSKILKGLGIFNKYQVSTRENKISNMGDYRHQVDDWLSELGY